MAQKTENAHVLAFDLYNSRVFERYNFYEEDMLKVRILSEMNNFLHRLVASFRVFDHGESCRRYQEAFMMSTRVVTYLYQDVYHNGNNGLSPYLSVHHRTLSHILEEGRQKRRKPIDIEVVYKPIIDRLKKTETTSSSSEKKPGNWKEDNYLYVLTNREGTGITDKFLLNDDIRSESKECSRITVESDIFTSKQKKQQIVTYQDRIDGIRKILSDQEVLKLLPSQYTYLDIQELFLYLFSNRELLTYDIPANVITHKKILIAFIEVVDMSALLPQRRSSEYPVFFHSFPRKILLKTLFEFLVQKQHEFFQAIFEDHFEFTYRFAHLGKHSTHIDDIREDDLLAIFQENMDYESFRTNLVITYPEIFYYDYFHDNAEVFNRLQTTLHSIGKEKPFDICLAVLCFQGDTDITRKQIRLLEKFVSRRYHIITARFMKDAEKNVKCQITTLNNRHRLNPENMSLMPSSLAFEAIKTLITL
jgi:hypothetical protein